MAIKKLSKRIIEIEVHRSNKHPRLAHAVALVFPCNHKQYLGYTIWKGNDSSNFYRTQECKIISIEFVEVMDKTGCKLCPPDELWLNDLPRQDFDAALEVAAEEDI